MGLVESKYRSSIWFSGFLLIHIAIIYTLLDLPRIKSTVILLAIVFFFYALLTSRYTESYKSYLEEKYKNERFRTRYLWNVALIVYVPFSVLILIKLMVETN